MQSPEPLKRPLLILTCGLTGTGKSTVAAEIWKRTGLSYIRSDVIRKKLARLSEDEHRFEGFGEGIYSEEFFRLTYDTLFNLASEALQRGEAVLIDASFKKRAYRNRAKKLALQFGVPLLLVECRCSDETAKQRLFKRSKNKEEPSDGRWEIYREQQAVFEKVTELSAGEHLVLDTDLELSGNVARVLEAVRMLQGDRA